MAYLRLKKAYPLVAVAFALILFFILASTRLNGEAITPPDAVADGNLMKIADSPDIYIAKIVGTQKFRRLVLNPAIFDSYGHLRWEDVLTVSRSTLEGYRNSNLVIEVNEDGSVYDPRIYAITSSLNSDFGERRWLSLTAAQFEDRGLIWDSVYYINHLEASPEFYPEREVLLATDDVRSWAQDLPQMPKTVQSSASCPQETYFYLDKEKSAVKEERSLSDQGRDEEADLLKEIACHPQAIWLVGGSPQSVGVKVASVMADAGGAIPVFVLYNNPDHTTSAWRSGVGDYEAWLRAITDTIGMGKAWVIVEPDAVSLSFAYSEADRQIRHNELSQIVRAFTSRNPNVRVYLDAGHHNWRPKEQLIQYLLASGIQYAHGFSVNVSNFNYLSDEVTFAKQVSNVVGGKPFIVDTSRNGNGPAPGNEWCNPWGRALGTRPTNVTGDSHIDAFLWIKSPGESDGTCNGGPSAGKFWLDYALDLVRNATR